MRNDLSCGDRGVASRRVRIGDQQNWETERKSASGRCVHAELRMHAANGDTADPALSKNGFEVSTEERVRSGLPYAQICGLNFQSACELPRRRTILQVSRLGFVLDEYHWRARGARSLGNAIDPRNRSRAVIRRTIAFAKTLLHINDKNGRVDRVVRRP